MQKKKVAFALILTFFISLGFSLNNKIKAQENLLSELSYLYLEKLVAAAKENYPKLKGFSTQVTAARHDLSSVKASWLDPFSFQYVVRSNQANTNAVDITTADILSGYQFGFSFNPGTLLARPGQVKKAKDMVKIAEFNLAEYNLQLETEVKRRYFVYLQYKTSLTSTTNAYLDAESNLKSLRLKYQKSEATLEQYNSASIAFNEANLTRIELESNYLIAKAALEELTVRKLEEIK
jgi:outer membrane protein TolC